MDIKYNTDTKIEDNARLYQLQKANFDQEVNTAVSCKLDDASGTAGGRWNQSSVEYIVPKEKLFNCNNVILIAKFFDEIYTASTKAVQCGGIF